MGINKLLQFLVKKAANRNRPTGPVNQNTKRAFSVDDSQLKYYGPDEDPFAMVDDILNDPTLELSEEGKKLFEKDPAAFRQQLFDDIWD